MDFDASSVAIEDKFMKLNPRVKRNRLRWRMDGRLEWTCKDGIGHTVFAPDDSDYVHGCSGGCKCIKIPKWTKKEKKIQREINAIAPKKML